MNGSIDELPIPELEHHIDDVADDCDVDPEDIRRIIQHDQHPNSHTHELKNYSNVPLLYDGDGYSVYGTHERYAIILAVDLLEHKEMTDEYLKDVGLAVHQLYRRLDRDYQRAPTSDKYTAYYAVALPDGNQE